MGVGVGAAMENINTYNFLKSISDNDSKEGLWTVDVCFRMVTMP